MSLVIPKYILASSFLLSAAVALTVTAHISGTSGSRTVSFCKELSLFELLGSFMEKQIEASTLCNLTQNCLPTTADT